MKKYIAILLVAAMATLGISACRKENSNKETKVQKDSDIKVVTTIFPEYDWVRQIAGEEADQMDITMLLDNGVDLHSYQPTAEDIMKVSDCDLFVSVGGESDAWLISLFSASDDLKTSAPAYALARPNQGAINYPRISYYVVGKYK